MSTTAHHTIDVASDVKLHATLTTPTSTPPKDTPTLIFLHFWGGSSRTWDRTISQLSTSFPTVAFDTRGWAKSTGPLAPDAYSIATLADDVAAVIKSLDIKRYILVGLSIGSKISAFIAGRKTFPGHLAGIILVSPAPPTPLILPPEIVANQEQVWEEPEAAEFAIRNFLLAGHQPEDIIKELTRDMMGGNAYARKAWISYGMKEDVSEYAKKSDVPALVIAGEKDLVEPVDNVKRLVHGVIQGSEMVIIQNSGHLVPIEAPEELASHIARFSKTSSS